MAHPRTAVSLTPRSHQPSGCCRAYSIVRTPGAGARATCSPATNPGASKTAARRSPRPRRTPAHGDRTPPARVVLTAHGLELEGDGAVGPVSGRRGRASTCGPRRYRRAGGSAGCRRSLAPRSAATPTHHCRRLDGSSRTRSRDQRSPRALRPLGRSLQIAPPGRPSAEPAAGVRDRHRRGDARRTGRRPRGVRGGNAARPHVTASGTRAPRLSPQHRRVARSLYAPPTASLDHTSPTALQDAVPKRCELR